VVRTTSTITSNTGTKLLVVLAPDYDRPALYNWVENHQICLPFSFDLRILGILSLLTTLDFLTPCGYEQAVHPPCQLL
jgi:hypothetical protein